MFGFLRHKDSIVGSGLLRGAVDNHSHILYGLDDGVKTQEDSLSILSWLEGQGLKTLWFTPHVMEDVPNTTEGIRQRFAELLSVYKGGLSFCLAAEYMMDNLYEERLAAKDLLTHGEEHVLVETSTWSPPIDLWGVLERTLAAGYRPILAHPERYRYMRKDDYKRLHEMGVLLQLNLPSIVGSYRNDSKERAEYLLGRGWYCMVGSDCHRFHALQEQDTKKVLDKKTIRQLADLMQGLPNRE